MASIDSMTFDQATPYIAGQEIILTVDYTPDVPGVTPTTFNATATITNAAGAVVATSPPAPFTVNVPAPAGDVVAVTDDGNRVWAKASDSGTVAVFSATA